MTRHRWGDPQRFDHKTERECQNGCGIVKVTHHQHEGGREVVWTEFYRGLDRVDIDGKTPVCERVGADA